MEQRNGRIDRKLQPSEYVYCHYFVYSQRLEDRILKVLIRKTETIKKELGSLSQVIDSNLAKTLRHGISHKALDSLESQIDSADISDSHRHSIENELEAARDRQNDLRQQIDRLRTQLSNSRENIGLTDKDFRAAISCSLQLLGADTLTPADHDAPRFSNSVIDP